MREQGQPTKANITDNSSEEISKPNDPIRAADSNRNEERDQRIGEEPDTKRLRSEKESTEQGKTQ